MKAFMQKTAAAFAMMLLIVAPFHVQATWSEETTSLSCAIETSASVVETGGTVSITWDVTGYSNVTINGEAVSANGGSFETAVTEDTTYTLIATTQSGDECTGTAHVSAQAPAHQETGACELTVEKRVSTGSAAPGDALSYTVTVKNTGSADCTGGGVMIRDHLDSNFVYESYEIDGDITAGYEGAPVYDSNAHSLNFNGHVLVPGESGKITIYGSVAKTNTCDGFVVKNQAKATALELNNFSDWSYSDIVKTHVDVSCDTPEVPVAPECPIDPAEGRTIVYFDERIRTDKTEAYAQTRDAAVSLTAGDYKVTLVSWDGYLNRVNMSQPNEQWKIHFLNGNDIIASSGYSTDLADYVIEDTKIDVTDNKLSIPSAVTAVRGVQPYYPDKTSPNSLNPICAAFENVTPDPTPAPVCEAFTASSNSVANGGGNVTLTWDTTNATNVTIYPTIGSVAVDGSETTFVSASTKFLLTATNAAGHEVTCDTTVVVENEPDPEPEVFSCSNNVVFTTTDSNIDEGQSATLEWNVTGADSVSISQIDATSFSGSQSVSPDNDTTYTLTAEKDDETISCPLTINVDEDNGGGGNGGGGGGSATPRCELEASETSIAAGEEVTLSWETSNAREVTLLDEDENIIFTTDDYLSRDKEDYYDYEITVEPTKDTVYTLIAERGSRDRDCEVEIEVEDNIVVLETRDQQPLVTGISLNEVPYTGFEAGTFASFLFYALLVLWALYITYIFVIRKEDATVVEASVPNGVARMQQAEALRPDLFPTIGGSAPANLPTTQKKSLADRW